MNKDVLFWEEQMDLLAQQDVVVIDNFFENSVLTLLQSYFEKRLEEQDFNIAAIGASQKKCIDTTIRNDRIFWIDKARDTEIAAVFTEIEDLKSVLNRMLFLSLSDYEFHLAHYPEGSYYQKHLDQFDNRNNRMISMIVYLHKNWQKGDGGELRIYPENQNYKDIAPLENRCILFRSDVLPHEVLVSNCSRKSLTGWMLYRPVYF